VPREGEGENPKVIVRLQIPTSAQKNSWNLKMKKSFFSKSRQKPERKASDSSQGGKEERFIWGGLGFWRKAVFGVDRGRRGVPAEATWLEDKTAAAKDLERTETKYTLTQTP